MKSLKKKFQAAILLKQNKPLLVDEVYFSGKLLDGQVFVKINYSGVCGSQLGEIQGIKGKDKYLPHLLGHEGVGEVLEINQKITKVKRGDKVLLHWMPSNGLSSLLPNYYWKEKKINAGSLTTFNTYAVVSENRLSKLPKNIRNEKEILMLGCTTSTAIGAVKKLTDFKKGDSVAVSGCGAIGMSIIKICKMHKAKNIIAIDINEKKLRLAKKLGATFCINSKNSNFKNKINYNFREGINHFFECTGNVKIISEAYECLSKRNGREILIGVPKFKKKASFYTLDLHLGKKLIGCKGGNFDPDQDLHRYIKIINKKEYSAKQHITQEADLKDINDVFSDMKKNLIVGKCILNLTKD